MGFWLRLLIGIPLAAIVTLALFLIMRALIFVEGAQTEEDANRITFDIVQQTQDTETRTRQNRPDEPEQVRTPPPPPRIQAAKAEQPQEGLASTLGRLPDLQVERVQKDDVNFSVADRDETPLVRIQNYPRRALERGIEGSCDVLVDINPDGSTSNIRVNCTDSVFERQAQRDLEGWKYQPKVVGGEAVVRRNIRAQLVYQLQD